jgi:hypothetical protein
MSLKAAKDYIERVIRSTPEYAEIKKAKNQSLMRTAMNSKIHSLNISYSTFETNNSRSINKLSTQDLKELYGIFIRNLKGYIGQDRIFSSLKQAEPLLNKDDLLASASGCILIISGINTSIIGYNYDAIRRLLSSAVKAQDKLMMSPLGVDNIRIDTQGVINSKSILELGHTTTSTPFAETMKMVLAYSSNPNLNAELNILLDKLYSTQASIGYEFLNKADNSKLSSGIVTLVIQPRDVNSELSVEESKLYRLFLNSIVRNLNLSEIPGSNTLKQDAAQFYKDKFLTAITGKKRANVKKHDAVKGSVKVGNESKKNKVATFKNTDLISGSSKTTPEVDLLSLQNLINQQLQDVVSANMGDGSRNDILNYRTGRFASSANVERLTMSRAGMITAYYDYMKYPYATFSTGGKQSSPKSRDPKLLIAKSIREIAQQVVTNKLRAVLV